MIIQNLLTYLGHPAGPKFLHRGGCRIEISLSIVKQIAPTLYSNLLTFLLRWTQRGHSLFSFTLPTATPFLLYSTTFLQHDSPTEKIKQFGVQKQHVRFHHVEERERDRERCRIAHTHARIQTENPINTRGRVILRHPRTKCIAASHTILDGGAHKFSK